MFYHQNSMVTHGPLKNDLRKKKKKFNIGHMSFPVFNVYVSNYLKSVQMSVLWLFCILQSSRTFRQNRERSWGGLRRCSRIYKTNENLKYVHLRMSYISENTKWIKRVVIQTLSRNNHTKNEEIDVLKGISWIVWNYQFRIENITCLNLLTLIRF